MIRDLLLGLRLAVGGGRMSGQALLRLVMTTFGVGLVVAILLPAASIGNVTSERSAREAARGEVIGGEGDALLSMAWYLEARDEYIEAKVVAAEGPGAPVPPGLDRIPGPGELVVSPELKSRLDSDFGHAVLARAPGTVIGVIGKPGLADAGDLSMFVGVTPERLAGQDDVNRVTAFGGPEKGFSLNPTLAVLVAPLVVALLLPLLIFVTTASRMGAAQRERRLAALRLLGVDARQVRRIAAAESLLGAVAGLVVGTVLFVLLRPLLGHLDLFGIKLFPEDFVPSAPMAVAIALLVPGLAVGAAIFGLRRTVVEPLGVVRQSKPVRRRMWWRWVVTAIGAALLLGTLTSAPRDNAELVGVMLSVGSALLLIGVTVLLPWAVEKLVRGIRGGPPSVQFAVRRLQLDSGTPSRVVSGLVVVLAGTILIQTLFASIGTTAPRGSQWKPQAAPAVEVSAYGDTDPVETAALVRSTPGVSQVDVLTETGLEPIGEAGNHNGRVAIGNCAALATQAELGSCADGDVFVVGDRPVEPVPMNFVGYRNGETVIGGQWTPPSDIRMVPEDRAVRYARNTLLVTPGALGVPLPDAATTTISVSGPGDRNALVDRVATAVSPLAWDVSVRAVSDAAESRASMNRQTETFRAILLAATLFVLAVAALSLLMLSIEQIVERRRPLAALSASGVPLAVLVRGSLWQNAIPVLVGVVLAVAAGIGLTLPTLRFAGLDFTLDAGLIGTVAAAAVAAVLVVTALTFPLLRQATKLDGLRAE